MLMRLEKFFPKKFGKAKKEDEKSIEQIKKFYQLKIFFNLDMQIKYMKNYLICLIMKL